MSRFLLALSILAIIHGSALLAQDEKKDYGALITNLESADRETRLEAINALAEIGPRARQCRALSRSCRRPTRNCV